MPSSVRPKGSGTGGRAPPVTPMSERQQMALLMQMTSTNQTGSRSPSSSNLSRSRDRNERGETPLHLAAIKGDAEQVSKLLAHRADPNAVDFAGWTPLHEACNHGWYEVACRLVQAGANVNARGLDDDTPLHDAASNGHVKLVRYLVERGADINAKNKKGKTPCDVATAAVTPYLHNPSLPITESAASQRVQPRARDDKKLPDSTSKKCPSPMESSDQVQPSSQQQPSQQAAPQQQQSQQQAVSTTKSTTAAGTQPADDVYEFKNVKETNAAADTKNATEPMDVQTESSDTLSTPGQQPPSDEASPTKRPFSEITDAADDVQPDDENRRKKRKDSDSGKEGKGGQQPARSTGQTGKTANKPGPAAAKSNTLSASKSNSADRKSPCPSPKPSNNPDVEQDDSKSDLKVPPLKIVIPQGSTAEQESGGNRNGKNSSQRTHQALPYVVASLNSNDSTDKDTNSGGNASPTENTASTGKGDEKKDGFTGSSNEEQKSTSGGHHQRVLRSSHRSGAPASSNQTSSTGSGATDRSSNNSSPLLQRSHSPSPNASPAAQPTSGQAQQTENTTSSSSSSQTSNSSGTKPTTEAQATTNTDADSNNSTSAAPALQPSASNSSSSSNTGSGGAASVELHPRKRKMRPSKEPTPAASQPHDNNTDTPAVSEVHPHEQPITNCYQLYLNIRKQIERRRKSLFPVQPKPPQGFKDYLMNRCTYVLAGTAPTVPNVTPPTNLPHQMKELFTEQEKERYKLRMQHVIEKEKLVLSVEQEILRVHGRAARALANQSLPFSVCTVLRDEEVYNIITPEQEEKDRNARSRYNGRLFLSWLQDVDDKWEKIKESMLLRHHNEAESLHAVQKMEWEWKLKELSLCEFKATPQIDDVHVPMVHVSDDFDLLPA